MSKRRVNIVGQTRKDVSGNGERHLQRPQQARLGVDHVGHRVHDAHGGGQHGAGAAAHRRDARLGRVVEGRREPAVEVRLAFEHDPVRQVGLADGPVGADVAGEAGDVVDDDRLATVDDADRLEADRTAGAGFDRAEGGLDRLIGQPPVVGLADLVDLDAETVGDEADLALELAGDGTGQHDPRLEVQAADRSRARRP